VKIYTCGPTVYDYAHIGNFRTFVLQDVLRRWLKYKGYEVYQVMNLTDVDDKTIRGARETGLSLKEYTAKYTEAFFEDADKLGIERVEVYPKATEHIQEMVELVKKLMDKGFAYRGEDGSVYFDISKFREYGQLSKVKLRLLKAKGRIKADQYSKEEAEDFALWKAWDEEDGDVFWETELGKGRPGWHTECAALSIKYLGETFDIHAGGVDLMFPHHENEIAQAEAATGRKFVNYWLHFNHLMVEGRKMSKSLGNFYTLRDLLQRGYHPKAIRYVLLSTHYRKILDFSLKNLEKASDVVGKLEDFLHRLKEAKGRKEEGEREEAEKLISQCKESFEAAMDDDLNVSIALASVFRLVREANRLIDENKLGEKEAEDMEGFLKNVNRVLNLVEEKPRPEKLPEELEKLLIKREEARKNRDWKTADALREELEKKGLKIEDTPKGVRWKWKISSPRS
jgi:cysteinyl-tRNA synthetase